VTTALAAVVQRWLLPEPGIAPFVFFYTAVALCAWLAGRVSGLIAVLLSAAAANWLFIEPYGELALRGPALVATALFVVSGSAVALLCGSLRHATDHLDAAERRAREHLASLRDADRAKDEFLAMLAHELRNPLAAITTATHLIRVRLGARAVEVSRPLDVLDRQTRHSARLLDDLLDVSRVTRGLVELRREPTDLGAVVRHAVEAQHAHIEEATHQVTLSLPGAPLRVVGDAVRLEQVVANLLTNAVKYTPAGGHIALRLAAEGGRAVLAVRDDGVGIEPALLPRIFEPFVQADQTLARTQGGLGLGLTLVHRLVALHGGSVEARSEGRGRGAELVVRLPLAPEAGGVHAEAPRATAAEPPAARRVLVVEDNVDAAEVLSEFLAAAGHDVEVAHDGPTALEAAERRMPEVVLLDIGLPGMDGYETARRLRERAAGRAPVLIAVSGYGQEEDRRRSREAGIAHHLTKPVDLDALAALVAARGRAAS
jgi:signal transduction histidine kinase/CheY-like chemotaxis protein